MKSRLQHDVSTPIDLTRRQMVGSVRSSHPVYVDLMPPCNDACPAGEDIQAWLAHAQAGHFETAWEILIATTPFPPSTVAFVITRAKPAAIANTSTAASASMRSSGSSAISASTRNWPMPVGRPHSGKRVLVIGAGPSGLSAAYHLARLGHEVEIHDAGPVAGGMLQFGIPAYRLPRAHHRA